MFSLLAIKLNQNSTLIFIHKNLCSNDQLFPKAMIPHACVCLQHVFHIIPRRGPQINTTTRRTAHSPKPPIPAIKPCIYSVDTLMFSACSASLAVVYRTKHCVQHSQIRRNFSRGRPRARAFCGIVSSENSCAHVVSLARQSL